MKPEWLEAWRENPRRWHEGALMLLPVGARVFEGNIAARRTKAGISWWVYFRAPVVAGSTHKKPKWERVLGCRNKSQAEGVLADRESKVFRGEYQPRTTRKEETLASFLPTFVKLRGHRKTVKKYEGQIRRQFMPKWGSLPLRAFKRSMIQEWYVARLTEQAVATANRELAALRTLFSEAIACDLCEINPCKGVKPRAENNARDRVLHESEAAALLRAASARPDAVRVLFALYYFTGARKIEALELRRSAVDLVRGMVRFRDAKTGAPRAVPMHPDLVAHVRWWLSQLDRGGDRMFPGQSRAEHMAHPRDAWAELCAAADVAVTPHELRHNFVSQLQLQGVSDTTIMELTGHKTLTMLKRYSHSRDHHRAEAVSRLPAPESPPALPSSDCALIAERKTTHRARAGITQGK